MDKQLYVLFEHSTGYALFHVDSAEDIGALLPAVEKSITDFSLFANSIKLIAFSPFQTGLNALDNANLISMGALHDDLKTFLETYLPKGDGVILGVQETSLSGAIKENLSISCLSNDLVSEVTRGIRLHFSKMVQGLTLKGEENAQLGLSHSYSRSKLKFNIHRNDNMIIQSIALLDQLDKDINTFSMKAKEWYCYHFPELVGVVSDNYLFCQLVALIGDRCLLTEDSIDALTEITQDSEKSNAILISAKRSMGMEISQIDLINVKHFCDRVISLTKYRQSLCEYLHKRMSSVAPNLSALIGDVVGARLISHAGSLTNLAKCPASTVQILGAEKALFRALKKRGNTPKYGLIFHSSFIGQAESKNKGRISRYLANKASIASRIDCFTEYPNSLFGEKLKEQVESRLLFFKDGIKPKKNVEVMKEAQQLYADFINEEKAKAEENLVTPLKKKKKRKSKKDLDEEQPQKISKLDEENDENVKTPKSGKKKKKSALSESVSVNGAGDDDDVLATPKSVKKKKKKVKNGIENGDDDCATPKSTKKKTPKSGKKKKKVVSE